MIYYKGQPVSGGSSGETYSTEETVIGAWIDGKPLYRKCIEATTPNNIKGGYSVATVPENADKITNLRGMVYIAAYKQYVPANFCTITNAQYCISLNVGDNEFQMSVTSTDFTNAPCVITVEYTKTTD